MQFEFDDLDLPFALQQAQAFGQARYGYWVTPNVDHVIRLREDAAFRALYAEADHVLLDSRFLARLLALRGVHCGVTPGSDLTAGLFEHGMQPDDRIVVIGGSAAQIAQLQARYGVTRLAHHNPPMGFIDDPAAVAACLEFVEAHSPFRYCFLAIGSPQQERIAQALKQRDRARGLALCIGASINFLTGAETRAPKWMQRLGIEWLYRLLSNPGRMWRRYLLRGPRVFPMLLRDHFNIRSPKK